jgi:pimeloyl-ACP methyl ester carboxylesterase
MPTIELRHGTVEYRIAGPERSNHSPVVFVHGLLVNGELWTGVAAALARHGIRSYAPNWPLGSHTIPISPTADQTPRGVARAIVEFIDALGVDDVTLVGNDTGGALCQFVLDTDHTRIGRVVLTNCDAFDKFPPAPFDKLIKAGSTEAGLHALLTPLRSKVVRHSPAGYGLLVNSSLDAALTRRWVDPLIRDAAIRRDTAAFLRAIDKADLLDVSTRLSAFEKPMLLVWGDADRFFKIDFARRLAAVVPDATLVEVEGGRTFLPLDEPDRLSDEIVAAFYPAAAKATGAAAAG